MTAKELIEQLQKIDPETIVFIRNGSNYESVRGFELVPMPFHNSYLDAPMKPTVTVFNRLVIV